MSGTAIDIPVLIVGAGPAGLAASLALSRYGVGHLLIERHKGTAHTPRAHILNQRTVEIFRHLGIEDQLHAIATPSELMATNLWVTTLADREVARADAWGNGADRAGEYRSASPSPMVNCPQTVLEPMLLASARDAGSDVRFEHEFVEFTEESESILSTIRDRRGDELITVRSRYLIGADGARSRVQAQAGLVIEGPDVLAHAANLWFRADLSRYLAHRPGVLTKSVMPGPLPPMRLGSLICHKPFTEFVLVFQYDPALEPLDNMDTTALRNRIRQFVGAYVDVEILGLSGWQVRAQVANHYSAGRVFCMGDAVHRHPPTNGLGLNMSIADAYNLAWKLALVVQGRAGQNLLDSYSAERQPIGAQGVRRAITSLRQTAALGAALGYTPGQSEVEGRRNLEELYQPGAAGEARRYALREAVALQNYEYNAHGVELGYRYGGPAIVPDERAAPRTIRDPELYYEATTSPGARLPHARLEQDGQPVSTLDLVDGLGFALLTGVGGEEWAITANEISQRTQVSVTTHVIGGAEGLLDPYGEWAKVSEVPTAGCVLVRPDRHVAWRCVSPPADGARLLAAIVDQILARRAATGGSSATVPPR